MSTDTAPKQSWWTRIAHPGQFVIWSRPLLWPLTIITAALFLVGLYYAFFNSPQDYQMGDTVRIMYVHVPNAWLSQFVYVVMTISAIGTLVWRHPMADVSMKTAAPLGALFTALALFTGSLWGRPTWGTFWEWDGRMTSTLVLLFLYLGIIALWRAFDDQLRAARVIAVFTLVGAVNIPIIKFSVDWWSTLHQPASVFRPDGPTMPGSILTPLFVMFFAFTFLFITLQLKAMHTEIKRRRVSNLARQATGSWRMIDLGPHAAFIIWAYLGVFIAVGGLIVWTLVDASSTDKKLTRLEAANPAPAGRQVMRYVLFGLPLIALIALVAVFATSMNRDPGLIRSVLIDKPAPIFAMAEVPELGVPGFDTAALKGEVTVVNVFASWCIPCRDEHPLLTAVKDLTGVRLFGINQADAPENVRAFLAELGNPYDAVGTDRDRRVSIDWGVYGVPETFVVNAEGVITFKHVGPLSPKALETELLPAIERARG